MFSGRLSSVLTLVFITTLLSVASGSTWYVDPAGNDSNSGTSSSPWRTIPHALSRAAAGDEIILRSGDYGEVYLSSMGASPSSWSNAVTVRAANGATPTLEYLSISGARNWFVSFEDLRIHAKVTTQGSACIQLRDASHLRFRNLDMDGIWSYHGSPEGPFTAYGVLTRITSSAGIIDDITVEDCTIRDVSSPIAISGNIGQTQPYAIQIRNNDISHFGSTGISLDAANSNSGHMLLEGNKISNKETVIEKLFVGGSVQGVFAAGGSGLDREHVTQTTDSGTAAGDAYHVFTGRFDRSAGSFNTADLVSSGGARLQKIDAKVVSGNTYEVQGILRGSRPSVGQTFSQSGGATCKLTSIVSERLTLYPSSVCTMNGSEFEGDFDLAAGAADIVSSSGARLRNPTYEDLTATHGSGISIRNHRVTVRGNIIRDCGPTRGIRTYQGVFSSDGYQDIIIENNLVYDVINVTAVELVDVGTNVQFNNNTIVGFRNSSYSRLADKYSDAIIPRPAANTNGSGFYMYNNILVGRVHINPGFTAFHEGNNLIWSVYDWTQGSSAVWRREFPNSTTKILAYDNYSATPDIFDTSGVLFSGGADFDTWHANRITRVIAPYLEPYNHRPHQQNLDSAYTLASGSMAIGFANPTYASGVDLLNATRDTSPDTGCYEYNGTGGGGGTPTNNPPIARAGSDQSFVDTGSGFVQVSLDGSASTDSDGTIKTYLWTADGVTVATGATATVQLAVGQHLITLTVTDDDGATDTDDLTVLISDKPVDVTGDDRFPPRVTFAAPHNSASRIPIDSLVVLELSDSDSGINDSSVVITLNQQDVYRGGGAEFTGELGTCRRTGSPGSYLFTFQPDENLANSQNVVIEARATDLAGNAMDDPFSTSFKVIERRFGTFVPLSAQSVTPAGSPRSARDAAGNIWTVWHAGQPGQRNVFIARRPAASNGFEAPNQLSPDNGDQCFPDIAIRGDGTIFVAWQDDVRGVWDATVRTSSDGQQWSPERKFIALSRTGRLQTRPALAVTDTAAYLAWQDNRYLNEDIYLARSTDGFATFTETQITTSTIQQLEPTIAADGAGNAWLVWSEIHSGQSDLYGASSLDNWTNRALVTGPGEQTEPTLAAAADGALHLAWTDTTPGNRDIFYAFLPEGISSSPLTGKSVIDDSSQADQLAPNIQLAQGQTPARVLLAWQDNRDASGAIYYAETDAGSDFAANLVLSGAQGEPHVAPALDGKPHLVAISTTDGVCFSGATSLSPHIAPTLVRAADGGIVGTPVSQMTSADHVCVEVPANALWSDLNMTISRVEFPPGQVDDQAHIVSRYEFGPSSMVEFATPVTITIPYVPIADANLTAYWYDPATGELVQSGMSDIEQIAISPALHAIRFRTTHFTEYVLVNRASATTAALANASQSTGDHYLVLACMLVALGLIGAAAIRKRNRTA